MNASLFSAYTAIMRYTRMMTLCAIPVYRSIR